MIKHHIIVPPFDSKIKKVKEQFKEICCNNLGIGNKMPVVQQDVLAPFGKQ